MRYIKRQAEETINRLKKEYPVVVVTGHRQVGKTTMLNNIKEKSRNYVNLDENLSRQLALNDPELFLEKYKAPLIIDEFQRCPNLLLSLKKVIDEKNLNGKKINGLYFLTGSQNFIMMKKCSESLVGRAGILNLPSFTSKEIAGKKPFDLDFRYKNLCKKYDKTKDYADITSIFKKIFIGGMPKLVTEKISRDDFFMDYVSLYLNRDVRELSQVGSIDTFNNFLVYVAARTGQELVYDDIANRIGISAPTAKSWISILENSGLIYKLRPYYNNITKRLIKTNKIYFMDTGLAAYLCGYSDYKTLMNGPLAGEFFETYVITEIVKNYMNMKKKDNLYYYRDIDKKEIDLIIEDGDTLIPIEIKLSKNPSGMSKNLQALNKLNKKISEELVICLTDEFIPYSKEIMLCPVGVIL